MSVVPLEQLREHLNMRGTGQDTELQRTLDAAEGHVAEVCGPLAATTRTVTAHASGDQLVLPAVRLSAVTALRDPDGQPVELTADRVNLLSGIIALPYRRPGAWSADVSIDRPLPAALREAVLIVAAHLWETQRSPSGGTASRPAGMGGPEPAGPRVPLSVLVPRRAELLMAPHRLPPAFA